MYGQSGFTVDINFFTAKNDEQQTNQAFKILNHYFEPFHGKVIKIVLAKTNPYQEIKIWDL